MHARAHAYYTTFIILIIIRIQLWGRWPSCILQGPYSTQIRQSWSVWFSLSIFTLLFISFTLTLSVSYSYFLLLLSLLFFLLFIQRIITTFFPLIVSRLPVSLFSSLSFLVPSIFFFFFFNRVFSSLFIQYATVPRLTHSTHSSWVTS